MSLLRLLYQHCCPGCNGLRGTHCECVIEAAKHEVIIVNSVGSMHTYLHARDAHMR